MFAEIGSIERADVVSGEDGRSRVGVGVGSARGAAAEAAELQSLLRGSIAVRLPLHTLRTALATYAPMGRGAGPRRKTVRAPHLSCAVSLPTATAGLRHGALLHA